MLLLLAYPITGVPGADDRDLPILETLQLPAEVQAVAVSPDGRRAAVALPTKGGDRTVLRLHSLDAVEPTTIKIPGLVRHLLFGDDDSSIYALEHRPAKRHEGEAFLIRIGLHSLEIEARLRLPPTARWIEPWRERQSLLIPARNEIRTITLPELRSGSLFRVLGENLCLRAIGGTRVLVGQDAALLRVDLSDAQGREGMPVRERIAMPAPVVFIDLEQTGRHAIAGLADGTDVSVSLDPLPPEPVESEAATEPLPVETTSEPKDQLLVGFLPSSFFQ